MSLRGYGVALIEVLWPGRPALAAGLRWIALGVVVGGTAGYLSPRTLPDTSAVRSLPPAAAWLAFAFLLGTWRLKLSRSLWRRVRNTHKDLVGLGSPVVWAYVLLFGPAAASSAWSLARGDGPQYAADLALVWLAWSAGTLVVLLLGGFVAVVGSTEGPWERPSSPDLFPDDPITNEADDLLQRGPTVELLAATIKTLSGASPAFVSLEAGWGTGKSSVVLLTRARLGDDGLICVPFSGFNFATSDRLVDALARAIEQALRERYASLDPVREFSAFYRNLKPVVERPLPIGLPELPPPDEPRERLERMLGRNRKTVVVFLEDLDRLLGSDLLMLLAAVQLLGAVRGFVFVLVLDRGRCEEHLAKVVADPAEYLRKAINARVTLPAVDPDLLSAERDRMIGAVIKARGVDLRPPRTVLGESDWLLALPTLRHIKQLANAYAANLRLLAGEIDAFDLLLATLIDQVAPAVFDAIDREPDGWLTSIDRGYISSFRRAMARAGGQTKTPQQLRQDHPVTKLLAECPTLQPFVDALFPSRADIDSEKGQHLACDEYFTRYRQRGVRSSGVADQEVVSLAAKLNTDPGTALEATKATILGSSKRVPLLHKLVMHAELLSAGVRAPVIGALAEISDQLDDTWSPVTSNTEQERARAVIWTLLELGRGGPEWQKQTLTAAIEMSSSLGFARALVGFAEPRHNRIITDFAAFDRAQLKRVLSGAILSRLEKGYDPFHSEPVQAPWILTEIGDPVTASRWVLKLDALSLVLEAVRAHGIGDTPPNRIDWSKTDGFDLDELRKGVDPKSPTPLGALLLAGPPKPAAAADASSKKKRAAPQGAGNGSRP